MDRRLHSIRSLRSLDLLNSRRNEKDTFNDHASDEIKELCAPFYLEQSRLEKFMNLLNEQVELGLQDEEAVHDLKLLNTFVHEIPKRKISGDYLCLDFKGRYYRVLLIRMSKDIDKTGIDETLYTIPRKVRLQSGSSVFKYIAETVLDFLTIRGLQENEYDLAFCFGFPVELVSLSQAYLLGWTKEFSCEAVVGQDVCNLFQKNLHALDLKVKVKAIYNDTVGVLAACALRDAECRVGIIVSAGINCCYYEKVSKISRPFAGLCQGQEVVINTEWGSFGDGGCLSEYVTKYDIDVSRSTLSPGKQTFEKMVSTLYIGELVRLLIVEATSQKLLFNGELPEKLSNVQSFSSQLVFDIDKDPPNIYLSTEVILQERFKVTRIKRSDAIGVRYICRAVVTRAGNLLGAACACFINRLGQKRTTIAVDGAFFRFSSTFPVVLVETITRLIPYSYTFKLKLIDDGIGKGAAAIIAAHEQLAPVQPRFTIFM